MIFLLPVIAAVIGWFMNSLAINIIFRKFSQNQSGIAAGLGAYAGSQLFSINDIKSRLTDPEKIRSIIPVVETHLDSFLRERLPKAMPVLSMFIGDSTINQIKSHLVTELDALFPIMISQYLDNVQQDLNLEKIVTDKISSISAEKLESTTRQQFGKELNQFRLLGALTGLITGLLAVVITLISHQ